MHMEFELNTKRIKGQQIKNNNNTCGFGRFSCETSLKKNESI